MKFFFIISLLLIFLRLPSLFEPHWYLDENLYLTIGQGISRGLLLYKQLFDHKPPSIYYLSSLFSSLISIKLFLFFIVSLTTYYFYRLASKLLTPAVAQIATIIFLILVSLPKLEGNIFNAELINLFPVILAFFLFFHQKSIILPAFLFGLAFTCKTPVVFDFFLFLALIKPKTLPLAIASFLAPTFFWITYFLANHGLSYLLSFGYFANYGYIFSWSSHYFLSQIILGLISFVLFWRYRQKSFLLVWFLVSLLAATLSSRPYPHYLLQAVPSLSLLFASLFNSSLTTNLKTIFFIVFSYLIIIAPINFYHYSSLNYYLNFYHYIFGRQSYASFLSFFGSQISSINQVVDYLSQNSGQQDCLYVWGNYPQIYYLSGLKPSARYLTTFHLDQLSEHQYLIDQLKINQPKYIIVDNHQPLIPNLANFISRYYHLEATVDNFYLYRQL